MKQQITSKEDKFPIPSWVILVLLLMLLACALGIGYMSGNAVGTNKPQHNTKATGWYYLEIPDSPHVASPTLELDYTANDTAYLNWYSKGDQVGYQVYLFDDSISIMDGNRLVKKLGYNTDIGKIMLKDNE